MEYGLIEISHTSPKMDSKNADLEDNDILEMACPRCYVCFTDITSLRKHVKEKHTPQVSSKYKCERCHFTCGSKYDLQQHSEGCSYDPYKCQHCDKCFGNARARLDHECNCPLNNSPHKCYIESCSFATRHMSSLKRHISNKHKHIPRPRERTHCQFCVREIMRYDNLIKHENICSRNPDRGSSDMKKNTSIQSKKPDHELRNTQKTISKITQNSNSNQGVSAKVKDRTCQCHLCGKNFANLVAFELHKKKCLLKQIRCTGCNQEFIAPKYLHAHQLSCRTKRLSCDFCHQTYTKCKMMPHALLCKAKPGIRNTQEGLAIPALKQNQAHTDKCIIKSKHMTTLIEKPVIKKLKTNTTESIAVNPNAYVTVKPLSKDDSVITYLDKKKPETPPMDHNAHRLAMKRKNIMELILGKKTEDNNKLANISTTPKIDISKSHPKANPIQSISTSLSHLSEREKQVKGAAPIKKKKNIVAKLLGDIRPTTSHDSSVDDSTITKDVLALSTQNTINAEDHTKTLIKKLEMDPNNEMADLHLKSLVGSFIFDDPVFPVRINIDDPLPVLIPHFDQNLHKDIRTQIIDIYNARWYSIMSHIRMSKRISTYNMRLGNLGFDMTSVKNFLVHTVYTRQKFCFKINFSPGFFLYNPQLKPDDGECGHVSHYYPSFSNFNYYDKPKQITNFASFMEFVDGLDSIDLLQFCKNARESTQWQLLFCCQVEFKITKLHPHILGGSTTLEVGCGVKLPTFITNQRSLITLTHDVNTVQYKDNLCLFRCYALLKGHEITNPRDFDKNVVKYFREYQKTQGKNIDVSKYKGFKLDELYLFERHFKVRVNVFALDSITINETMGKETVASIVRESCAPHKDEINCSLWENHFSYITALNLYCKKYPCSRCDKIFKSIYTLKRHRKTECNTTKNVFPGGPYKANENIFEFLESEGIKIPKNICRYYPYRIIFDLESFQSQQNLPDNTPCVDYLTHHELLSAAVISTVPEYENPKVFMVSKDKTPSDVVIDMLRYMNTIAKEAYR